MPSHAASPTQVSIEPFFTRISVRARPERSPCEARRSHSAKFKTQIALEAIRSEKTIADRGPPRGAPEPGGGAEGAGARESGEEVFRVREASQVTALSDDG